MAAERIRPRWKRWLRLRPSASKTIRTARQARGSPSRSEQSPADSALRQHRLDPVGEVDAVGLLAGVAVERRAGAHVGGDVGDGDPDDPAARVARIVVRLGVDGVVVVAGVGRVDGDQRQLAQVGAAGEGRGLGGFGFGLGRRRRSRSGCRGRGWRSARRRAGRPRGRPPPAPCRASGHSGARRCRRPGRAPGRRPSGRAPSTSGISRLSLERRSTGSTRTSRRALRTTPRMRWALWPSRLISRASTSPLSSVSKRTSSRSPSPGAPAALLAAVGREPGQRRALVGLGRPHEEIAVGVALDHVGDADRREAAGGVRRAALRGAAIAPDTPMLPRLVA